MDVDWKAAAVIAAGAVVRLLFWLTTPVTGDGCLNFAYARYMAENIAVPPAGIPGQIPLWYPPLFHIITAILYRLTGILTLTPLLAGIAGLIAFYLFCRRFYGDVALYATAILALLPFHVYYSGIGFFDTLILMLSVAAFYFYFRYLEGGKTRDLAYAAVISSLSALTHYHGFVPLISISLHLGMRNRRKAAVFLAVGLLLSSPWYIRNYIVFGNPVWPKVFGGKYPADVEVNATPLAATISGLLNPGRWSALFLDFWVGAPNSGEDFLEKVDAVGGRIPMLYPLVLVWLACALALTMLAIRGSPSLNKGKRGRLPLIILLVALLPFANNSSARMFVSLMPFAVVAMAYGFVGWRFRRKVIVAAAALAVMAAGSYAYSYTYMRQREPYKPFFDEMRTELPDNAVVLMPFNTQECLYYSGKKCLRMGAMGGREPKPDGSDLDEVMGGYGIWYVCCSSLNYGAHPINRMVCERYKDSKPVLEYEKDGVWGRCWGA